MKSWVAFTQTLVPKHSPPPPPPGIPRDGALRCPHYHSPEDLNFEQRDQGFSDFVMHFRQPEVPEHLVLN